MAVRGTITYTTPRLTVVAGGGEAVRVVGQLDCSSTDGQGSTFTVTLRRA